jgi:hypothetical protein
VQVRVEKARDPLYGGFWTMRCDEHGERVWSCNFADAYEAAAGHLVMHHSRQKVAA